MDELLEFSPSYDMVPLNVGAMYDGRPFCIDNPDQVLVKEESKDADQSASSTLFERRRHAINNVGQTRLRSEGRSPPLLTKSATR